MAEIRCVRIVAEGRVQGVSFRAFVLREAQQRAVSGFARNLRDGRVEVVAQGEADAVAALCEACGRGPIGARVTRVDIRDAAPDPTLAGFSIRADA